MNGHEQHALDNEQWQDRERQRAEADELTERQRREEESHNADYRNGQ